MSNSLLRSRSEPERKIENRLFVLYSSFFDNFYPNSFSCNNRAKTDWTMQRINDQIFSGAKVDTIFQKTNKKKIYLITFSKKTIIFTV